jgi:hypothetical protein
MFTLETMNANRGDLLRVISVNYMLLKTSCCKDDVKRSSGCYMTRKPVDHRGHVIVIRYGKYVLGRASC